MHDSDYWEPIEGLRGAFPTPGFFLKKPNEESLLTAWAEDPELDRSEEGQRRLIHHCHASNPELKSVAAVDGHPLTLLRP